jgi:hypothetical protein
VVAPLAESPVLRPTSKRKRGSDAVLGPRRAVIGLAQPWQCRREGEGTSFAMTIEARVKEVVLSLVHAREPFTPLDVAERVERDLGAVPIARIAKAVRRAYDELFLQRFGYRRTISQQRTAQGVVTAVLYAPPVDGSAGRIGAHPQSAGRLPRATRAPQRPSKHPTRSPIAKPYGYLDLALADVRRLERITAAIQKQIDSAAGDLIRLGQMLDSVKSLVGATGLRQWAERELGMSGDTALRWVRIFRVLTAHPELERLSVLKPACLYKLVEPSFPADLREAILRDGGLVVDGERRPLGALRVRDLARVKAAARARQSAMRALQRAIAKAPAKDRAELEARLREIAARPQTHVGHASDPALEGLTRQLETLAGDPGFMTASGEQRRKITDALRRLLQLLSDAEP